MNSIHWILLILTVYDYFVPPTSSYNILGIFPTLAVSHYKLGHSLMKGLALVGHNVTIISPYKMTSVIPNYREIKIEDLEQFWIGKKISIFMKQF